MDSIVTALALAALPAALWAWWRQRGKSATLSQELEAHRAENARLQAQQRQALAGAQAQLAALFNSLGEGVLLLDREGRIDLVNPALEQLFQLTADIRGRTLLEAFRLAPLHELVNRAGKEGKVLGVEIEPGGMERRCLQVNAALIEGGGGGTLLVFRDLTRLKQLENTRQEFVANVSHELRTPLSMIKGYVETLRDGAKDDPAVATRFLEIIQKHTDRLTSLIDDLLKLSQLDAGRVPLKLRGVGLRDAVAHVLEELGSAASDRQVTLENQVPPGLQASADPERLHQVFFNLIDNAIRHGRQGGQAAVAAHLIEGGGVEVRVVDDGPGVPAEALARVFERFFRVDRARSREQGGTGLGLAIVKHLVLAHGGKVWAQSEPGQGAVFCFTLPPAPDKSPPAATAA